MAKFLAICLSSTIQKTISFERVELKHVNRSTHYRLDASGKAINSARILEQLKSQSENAYTVHSICPLGSKNAKLFLDLAKQDNLSVSFVKIPGFTRECCTVLDKSNKTTTELVVGEPNPSHKDLLKIKKTEEKLVKKIFGQIKKSDFVLLAGSRPDFWKSDLYPIICENAVKNEKTILADFWGKDLLSTLEKTIPSIIKINDEEYCKTFDLDFPCDSETLKNHISKKSEELKNIIIITRGTDSTLAADCGKLYECATEKIDDVVNTTACGDSFNAGFLQEYAKSKNIEAALKKGTWAAARNAEKECPGTVL